MNNSGVITHTATTLDIDKFQKYTGGKNALVAQGGGQRGIFTAGVLDAFLLSNFDPFDEFYGTSAGALNLCAFLCRQSGLARSFITELTTDPQFFHLFSYIRRKQYLDLDWALNKICEYPYKLDIDMGRRVLGKRRAMAAVTDSATMLDAYLPMLGDNWFKALIASCAIPRLYHQPVEVDGKLYVDGGVSASIPVQEAWRQNARLIVAIRTESETLGQEKQLASLETTEVERFRELEWFRESFSSIQGHWQQRFSKWKSDWNNFFFQQIERSKEQKKSQGLIEPMNGGRWLFGADDIYRMSHLLGDKFDAGLADMLMVHYQTYSLTEEFLREPPDDCFIVQIRPAEPLKSTSLLSKPDDLIHDYELGLKAGYQFVDTYLSVKS